jgi:hypothetical protein
MADFALWGTACERTPGAFMRAYENNRASAVEIILEADLVATAVRTLMKVRGGTEWAGTSSALLKDLNEVVDEGQHRDRAWPSQPNVLSGRLRRAATNLRKVGIEVTFEAGHRRGRIIHITVNKPTGPDKERNLSSSPSSPSPDGKKFNGGRALGEDDPGDDARTMGTVDRPLDGEPVDRPHRPRTVLANPLKNNGRDDGDDGDDDLRTQSAPEPVCRRCGIPGNASYGQLIRAGCRRPLPRALLDRGADQRSVTGPQQCHSARSPPRAWAGGR